ncbi:hypothetical protein QUF70_12595, partial [Desulfobacterales bacterium HSG17]|nr:hypothetical protein [Desulfobacterales bacterium HSG17]
EMDTITKGGIKMKNLLLEEYSQADFSKRLDIFLYKPQLRQEFIKIDQTISGNNPKLRQFYGLDSIQSIYQWLKNMINQYISV